MIEIRTILPREAEEFLALLCLVFGLDQSRAREVFFTEPTYDLKRKWALFADGQMRTILTTSALTFGWGRAIGIAGVATHPAWHGLGNGRRLLETVLERSEAQGEPSALLFAHRESLYARCGFQTVDEVVRAPIETSLAPEAGTELPLEKVQAAYTEWAGRDLAWLRRDERRWSYWTWQMRRAEPFLDGYWCTEPSVCREAVPNCAAKKWPVPRGTAWFGLSSVAKDLGVPLGRAKSELLLMTRGVPTSPKLFMTDQF